MTMECRLLTTYNNYKNNTTNNNKSTQLVKSCVVKISDWSYERRVEVRPKEDKCELLLQVSNQIFRIIELVLMECYRCQLVILAGLVASDWRQLLNCAKKMAYYILKNTEETRYTFHYYQILINR